MTELIQIQKRIEIDFPKFIQTIQISSNQFSNDAYQQFIEETKIDFQIAEEASTEYPMSDKIELKKLKMRFNALQDRMASLKTQNLLTYNQPDQRQKLLGQVYAVQNQGDRLEKAQRISLETTQIGMSTLSQLQLQGNQLNYAHSELMDKVDARVNRAEVLLKKIVRRRRRIYFMWAMIILLILGIGIGVVFFLLHKK